MRKQVIVFHYELRGSKGEILDSSRGAKPLAFLEGAQQIVPGLEEALLLLKEGESKDISVPYQDAYGAYDQALVAKVPRNQFPPQAINVGDILEIQKDGALQMISVVEVNDDLVTIDGNHPLAGKDLKFFVEVTERRDATAEEIAHGHAHTSGGHHH